MTLTQIRAEIRLVTGVSSTSIISDAVLTDLINKGQTILADDANLFYGFATRNSVDGTGEYQMQNGNNVTVNTWTKTENAASAGSSNLNNMIRLYRVDFDGERTTRIGLDQIYNLSNGTSDVSMPTAYGYYVNSYYLGIFPIPNAVKVIKVYYYFLPIALSADGNVPMLDSRYHESLIYYGAWKVVERLRDLNLIPYFKNEWNEWKEKVLLDRQIRAGESKISVAYKDF